MVIGEPTEGSMQRIGPRKVSEEGGIRFWRSATDIATSSGKSKKMMMLLKRFLEDPEYSRVLTKMNWSAS